MKILLLTNMPRDPEEVERHKRFADLANNLEEKGWLVRINRCGSAAELEWKCATERPDLVFSATYYTSDPPPYRKNVHAVLEQLGYPYVGSSPATLELVLSKARLKKRWQECGIRTPGYEVISTADDQSERNLHMRHCQSYPYIVKPSREGNSRGLDDASVVTCFEDMKARIDGQSRRYGELLIEEYLGRFTDIHEYTVAQIGSGETAALGVCEILLTVSKPFRLVTTDDKDHHHTRAVPLKDSLLRGKVLRFAGRAFQAAGILDYGRCDVIYAGGELYAIEINGQPMIPDRWFAACASDAGYSEEQYIPAILTASLHRQGLAFEPSDTPHDRE